MGQHSGYLKPPIMPFQHNPGTWDLKLRRRFVTLAYQEGVYYACQRNPESGIPPSTIYFTL